ncbi:MAG: GIY-YIG nuclease family protein [Gammaproteobacteria bacterium]
MDWYVYIILCTDDSLYTGITIDVERRLSQHAAKRGAKYFRGRAPRRLIYLESRHTRSSATRREVVIKKMQRVEKDRLILSKTNEAPAS